MPSIDPSASPSGFTWHASATSGASAIAAAALSIRTPASATTSPRDGSSTCSMAQLLLGVERLAPERTKDVLHALPLLDRRIQMEVQGGEVLHPPLPPEDAPEARCRRPQRRFHLVVRSTERGIVDPRLAKIGRDVDAGDRHEREPRVVHALELVGQRFAHDLVDARRPRILPRRLVRPAHHDSPSCGSQSRVPSASTWTTSTSSTSTSGARATNRSTSSSTSRRWPSLAAMSATPISARCH